MVFGKTFHMGDGGPYPWIKPQLANSQVMILPRKGHFLPWNWHFFSRNDRRPFQTSCQYAYADLDKCILYNSLRLSLATVKEVWLFSKVHQIILFRRTRKLTDDSKNRSKMTVFKTFRICLQSRENISNCVIPLLMESFLMWGRYSSRSCCLILCKYFRFAGSLSVLYPETRAGQTIEPNEKN